jgi:hypothetical protein
MVPVTSVNQTGRGIQTVLYKMEVLPCYNNTINIIKIVETTVNKTYTRAQSRVKCWGAVV